MSTENLKKNKENLREKLRIAKMIKKKETHMSATALNRMIRKIVGSENMHTIRTLALTKASRSADPVQYYRKTNTVVINCPTNILTIGGSFPDLLSGMTNLKRITKNIGIEIDQYIRSSQKEPIKDEVYPDNASIMYSTQIKEDVVQVQARSIDISSIISSEINVDQQSQLTYLEVQLMCSDQSFSGYGVRVPIHTTHVIDGVRFQKNKRTQIVRGFCGTAEKICCVVSLIERNVLFVTISTPTSVHSYMGKLVLNNGNLDFENIWSE